MAEVEDAEKKKYIITKDVEDKLQKLIDCLIKLHEENLILKRIKYKSKNQLNSSKNFKYISELVKSLERKLIQGLNKRKIKTSKS